MRGALHNAFSETTDAFEIAYRAIESYCACANHRHDLLLLRHRVLYPSNGIDSEQACNAYDEAVATYGPDALKPYTVAYLDAHTDAMNSLNTIAETLTTTFNAFNPTDERYAVATKLFESLCEMYALAADAYAKAVFCAKINAQESQIKVLKDRFEADCSKLYAARPDVENPAVAKSKAAAFRAKVNEDDGKTKTLEQCAKRADERAAEFFAQAEFAKLTAGNASARQVN